MTTATIRYSQTRPSKEVGWYLFTPEEIQYIQDKYSTLTVHDFIDSGVVFSESNHALDIQKEFVISGDLSLVTELFNELNNPTSYINSNKVPYFQANGLTYSVTYSED